MSRFANRLTLILVTLSILIPSAANAAPIDPASLSGRILHHQADVGVFTDAAGTTAATNGQTVRHWADQSASNSNALNTAAAGSQATFVTGAFPINNLPALRFDGNDYLSQALDLNTGAKSVFVVYTNDGVAPGSFASVFSFRDSTSSIWTEYTLENATGGYQDISFVIDMPGSTTSRGLASVSHSTTGHAVGLTYDGGSIVTNASFSARYDLTTPSVVASGAFGRTATDLGAIGARLTAGLATTIPFDGDIGEIVVFDRELPADEFEGVQEFLYNKYFVLPPVPEPSTGLLVGVSVFMWGRRARRRSQKA